MILTQNHNGTPRNGNINVIILQGELPTLLYSKDKSGKKIVYLGDTGLSPLHSKGELRRLC